MIPRWRVEIESGGRAYEVEVEAVDAVSAMLEGTASRRRLLRLRPGEHDGADRAVVQLLAAESRQSVVT